jgi:hypothetical protein
MRNMLMNTTALCSDVATEGNATLSKDDVKPFRVAYKKAHGKSTVLTLEQISGIVLSADDKATKDDIVTAMVKLETADDDDDSEDDDDDSEDKPAGIETATGSARVMIELAGKADAELIACLDAQIEHKLNSKTGALHVLVGMIHAHTEAVIKDMPIVGSHKKDVGANGNYDEYDEQVTNSKGEQKKKTRSSFSDYYDATTLGRKDYEMITLLADAKADNPKADTLAAIKARYGKILPKADLNSEHGYWTTRRTEGRNMVKRAVRLFQKIAYVRETLPKVDVRYALLDYDKPIALDNLRKTNLPIIVFEKKPPHSAWAKSIGTFLSFDVDKALKDGGTASDLVASATRAGNGGSDTDTVAIRDVKQFGSYCAELAAYLDPLKGGYDTVVKALGSKSVDPALILSIGDAAETLEALKTKIEKAYQDLSAQRAERNAAEVAAKAKQNAA